METSYGTKIISVALSLCMILSMLPTTALANEPDDPVAGLAHSCPHHPEHTEACGYAEAVEAADYTQQILYSDMELAFDQISGLVSETAGRQTVALTRSGSTAEALSVTVLVYDNSANYGEDYQIYHDETLLAKNEGSTSIYDTFRDQGELTSGALFDLNTAMAQMEELQSGQEQENVSAADMLTQLDGLGVQAVAIDVTFAAGEDAVSLTIEILNDAIGEYQETFLLAALDAEGKAVETAQQVFAIADDDEPAPSVSVFFDCAAELELDPESGEAELVFRRTGDLATATLTGLCQNGEPMGWVDFAPWQEFQTVWVLEAGTYTLLDSDGSPLEGQQVTVCDNRPVETIVPEGADPVLDALPEEYAAMPRSLRAISTSWLPAWATGTASSDEYSAIILGSTSNNLFKKGGNTSKGSASFYVDSYNIHDLNTSGTGSRLSTGYLFLDSNANYDFTGVESISSTVYASGVDKNADFCIGVSGTTRETVRVTAAGKAELICKLPDKFQGSKYIYYGNTDPDKVTGTVNGIGSSQNMLTLTSGGVLGASVRVYVPPKNHEITAVNFYFLTADQIAAGSTTGLTAYPATYTSTSGDYQVWTVSDISADNLTSGTLLYVTVDASKTIYGNGTETATTIASGLVNGGYQLTTPNVDTTVSVIYDVPETPGLQNAPSIDLSKLNIPVLGNLDFSLSSKTGGFFTQRTDSAGNLTLICGSTYLADFAAGPVSEKYAAKQKTKEAVAAKKDSTSLSDQPTGAANPGVAAAIPGDTMSGSGSASNKTKAPSNWEFSPAFLFKITLSPGTEDPTRTYASAYEMALGVDAFYKRNIPFNVYGVPLYVGLTFTTEAYWDLQVAFKDDKMPLDDIGEALYALGSVDAGDIVASADSFIAAPVMQFGAKGGVGYFTIREMPVMSPVAGTSDCWIEAYVYNAGNAAGTPTLTFTNDLFAVNDTSKTYTYTLGECIVPGGTAKLIYLLENTTLNAEQGSMLTVSSGEGADQRIQGRMPTILVSKTSTVAPDVPDTPPSSDNSDSASVTYTSVVESAEHGTISVWPKSAEAGDKVTITPIPDAGYQADKVTVTDRSGREIKVTDNGNGTYGFTQPAGKVTISVTFAATEAGTTTRFSMPAGSDRPADPGRAGMGLQRHQRRRDGRKRQPAPCGGIEIHTGSQL